MEQSMRYWITQDVSEDVSKLLTIVEHEVEVRAFLVAQFNGTYAVTDWVEGKVREYVVNGLQLDVVSEESL